MQCDFSYQTYTHFINTLKRDYRFVSLSKAKQRNGHLGPNVILRHDIDLSVQKALLMAKIEARLKVRSVYFLFPKSPFYNTFASFEESLIRQIISLGHYVGLHFDFARSNGKNSEATSQEIKREISFLQEYYDVRLDSVSFHRPKSLPFLNRLKIASYPHAYESFFLNTYYTYLSDSRAQWRFGFPLDHPAYKKKQNLHLLIHPEWWHTKPVPPTRAVTAIKREKVERFDADLAHELSNFWQDVKRGKVN